MTETEQLVIDLYKARANKKAADRDRKFSGSSIDMELARRDYLAASGAAATALRRVLAEGKRLEAVRLAKHNAQMARRW